MSPCVAVDVARVHALTRLRIFLLAEQAHARKSLQCATQSRHGGEGVCDSITLDAHGMSQVAHFLEASDTALWARLFWTLATTTPPLSPAMTEPQPVHAQTLTNAARELLDTAHDDVVAAVYAEHSVITDDGLPLAKKLASLPACAGAAADAAALRSCLRNTAEGPCVTLDPRETADCARVAAAAPRVPELRALALRITGNRECSAVPALRAATQLLATERALPCVTDIELCWMVWPVQPPSVEAALLTQLLARTPCVTRLRLPDICKFHDNAALLATALPGLTALRRLYLAAAVPCEREILTSFLVQPKAVLALGALPCLNALRDLDVSGSGKLAADSAPEGLADGVRCLPQLHRLRASCALLRDADVVAIIQVVRCTLRHLDVSHNRLRCGAECARAICSAVSLQRLHLGGNIISDAAALARQLSTLTALRHLDLCGLAAMTWGGIAALAAPIQRLNKLSFLNLGGTFRGPAPPAALAATCAALPLLRDFCASEVLSGEPCAAIAASAATALRRLRISFVRPACAQQLAVALPTLSRLLHLKLRFVYEGPETLAELRVSVPEEFTALLRSLPSAPQLQSLHLHGLEEYGARAEHTLQAVLSRLPSLAVLDVRVSLFNSGAWAQALPACVTYLALAQARQCVRCEGAPWPEMLSRITQLRSLSLDGLRDESDALLGRRWGAAIAQLTCLHTCELSVWVGSTWVQELFPHLCRCHGLTRLFIRSVQPSRTSVELCQVWALARHVRMLPRLRMVCLRNFDIRNEDASALEAAIACVPGLELQLL